MEKKEIKVNYAGSGVNTLRDFGSFFFFVGVIAIIVAVIGFSMYTDNIDRLYGADDAAIGLTLGSSSISVAIGCFVGGAVCKGLSGIARAALYQRMVLEDKYYFVDK